MILLDSPDPVKIAKRVCAWCLCALEPDAPEHHGACALCRPMVLLVDPVDKDSPWRAAWACTRIAVTLAYAIYGLPLHRLDAGQRQSCELAAQRATDKVRYYDLPLIPKTDVH